MDADPRLPCLCRTGSLNPGSPCIVLPQVDENGYITDSRFKTFGCGSAIASSSVVTEWIKGKPLDEVVKIKNSEIAKHLSLPPVKLHCSMLAEDAIKAAVKDIQAKRAGAAKPAAEAKA
ncbi:hypothetical protein DUNSADRAFT_1403 [Dunaliella salina]|uniref:NIF system FeS cluster assembly NifU N-terminal domain-containing protein n=1 Tax=Dunaliella salina TaxID=3046 RepID=A0ABQ7GX40_DUNSA|nr:hypothetical protein DUNSADRAFT_1403 [Dunaliella salina]|eukprot:KAF5839176.1 hypothetical protein DUNSADRAFT_1403 [Dunaliella salina]